MKVASCLLFIGHAGAGISTPIGCISIIDYRQLIDLYYLWPVDAICQYDSLLGAPRKGHALCC